MEMPSLWARVLPMGETQFYQSHLDRVSRSFAFCISRLEGEMRDWVSLSYLLCRLLDTVEDAPWSSAEAQGAAFDKFQDFLQSPPSGQQVMAWAALFPANIDSGEAMLLADSHRCFANLHALPEMVREKIRQPVMNMYRGMRHFLAERKGAGTLRLKSIAEVNQYCFFVAGLVGELLTDLVSQRWPSIPRSQRQYLDAHHFGLFLQKINLLKDQAKDEKEGRYLVPSRPELLASVARDAEGAIRYLQSLPVAEKGFRLFCAWSLFIGLASLPWIERSKLLGLFLKIPRVVTERLIGSVEKIIDDNQALVRLFREMLPTLPRASEPSGPLHDIPWMGSLYQGQLRPEDFRELGLCPIAA
jgi:phytoene/squalene synthetase